MAHLAMFIVCACEAGRSTCAGQVRRSPPCRARGVDAAIAVAVVTGVVVMGGRRPTIGAVTRWGAAASASDPATAVVAGVAAKAVAMTRLRQRSAARNGARRVVVVQR